MERIVEPSQRQTIEGSKTRIRRSLDPSGPVSLPTSADDASRELIARRAYELFELRGGDHGHDVEDLAAGRT